MGQAGSSASPGDVPGSAPRKTCYYELLSVERTATQEDIKKAYKRKALELHPDRNYNDVERTTKLFAEVSAAYEILSDPQERAWYDSHREAILRGDSDPGSGAASAPDVTTTPDVLRWFGQFTRSVSFEDGNPRGFYAIVNRAFSTLADEEMTAWEEANYLDPTLPKPEYPMFGNSKTSYDGPGGVRAFYNAWTNFTTTKTFAWEEMYRYSDAPDRRVKRAMEKENAKLREAARREFIDTVVEFVKFVRKRDPRWQANLQTEAQRQAALLAASKEQAARQRKENAAKRKEKVEVAAWTQFEQAEEGEEGGDDFADEWSGGSEDEEQESFECIVCKKTFRSEGQMVAHEKSKKHVKAVKDLQRQMRKENKEFDLDRDVRGREKVEKPELDFEPVDLEGEEQEVMKDMLAELETAGNGAEEYEDKEDKESVTKEDTETNGRAPNPSNETDSDEDSEQSRHEQPTTQKPHSPSAPPAFEPGSEPSDSEDPDSDYVSPETFASRLVMSDPTESDTAPPSTPLSSDAGAPKVGKAKAKRLKKAQQQEEEEKKGGEFVCEKCRNEFPSKTKLFTHLKENPGHAKLVPVGAGGAKKKAKKGKR